MDMAREKAREIIEAAMKKASEMANKLSPATPP